MTQVQSAEETARWSRYFAVECNNRAWNLAEAEERTPADDKEMLYAAYVAAYHWSKVGQELNAVRAMTLLAQVHALLGHADLAMENARAAFDYIMAQDSPDWEVAFAHAVLAHAAAVSNDTDLHRSHYVQAQAIGEALGEVDRRIFLATFARIPAP